MKKRTAAFLVLILVSVAGSVIAGIFQGIVLGVTAWAVSGVMVMVVSDMVARKRTLKEEVVVITGIVPGVGQWSVDNQLAVREILFTQRSVLHLRGRRACTLPIQIALWPLMLLRLQKKAREIEMPIEITEEFASWWRSFTAKYGVLPDTDTVYFSWVQTEQAMRLLKEGK